MPNCGSAAGEEPEAGERLPPDSDPLELLDYTVWPYKVYGTLVVCFCAAQSRLTVHVCVKLRDSEIVDWFTEGSQLWDVSVTWTEFPVDDPRLCARRIFL